MNNMKNFEEFLNESKDEERHELNVKFSNLKDHQLLELQKLLTVMQYSGNVGASRDFKIGLDGDGGFRMTVEMDKEPEGKDKEKCNKACGEYTDEKLFISFE